MKEVTIQSIEFPNHLEERNFSLIGSTLYGSYFYGYSGNTLSDGGYSIYNVQANSKGNKLIVNLPLSCSNLKLINFDLRGTSFSSNFANLIELIKTIPSVQIVWSSGPYEVEDDVFIDILLME